MAFWKDKDLGAQNQRTFAFSYSPPATTLCLGILVCLGSFCVCVHGLGWVWGKSSVSLCSVWGGLLGVHSLSKDVGVRGRGGAVGPPPPHHHSCTRTLPCALGGGVGEAGLIFVFNY